jgi:hypothetical protein
MPQLELPAFEATKSKDFPGFLVVWCPRDDCPSYEKRPFVVHKQTWLKKRETLKGAVIRGRTCPYCARVSLPH